MRRVTIVNTTDRGGGAERVAVELLDGFGERGTDTWLAVGDRRTDHPRVVALHTSPHIDYRPYGRADRRMVLSARAALERRLGIEDFNHPYSRRLLDVTGARPDLVLLNNLHGGFFDLRGVAALSRSVPVVLRLADSWTFTGHCALPGACPRWETGCGSCPDIARTPAVRRDATRLNWKRKRRLFASARLSVVAPSRWMIERAQRSLLAPGVERWGVVPNGVDIETFLPGGGGARGRLGIDPRASMLLFVATGGADAPHKDFATLRAAFAALAADAQRPPLDLVVAGGRGAATEIVAAGARIHHVPFEHAREPLAELYRAADLYVHAAAEEAFCLSAAEALACGTPVVAAADGGIREVVRHEVDGLCLRPGRVAELTEALRVLTRDEGRRSALADAAVAGRRRLDRHDMIDRLHRWCRGSWEAAATPVAPSSP